MFPKRKLLTPGLMMLTLLSAVFGVFAKGTEDKVMAAHKASPEQYQLLLENPQVWCSK